MSLISTSELSGNSSTAVAVTRPENHRAGQGHIPLVARWGGGLAALLSLSELVEWGWSATRFVEEEVAMSSLAIALSMILLGPASALWLGPDTLKSRWQAMSPARLKIMAIAGMLVLATGYVSLLDGLLLDVPLREIFPLSAMLLLFGSGFLAMAWQGQKQVSDRAVPFLLFLIIIPVVLGIAVRLTDNIWRPSVLMTIAAASFALTAAAMAALRRLPVEIGARPDETQARLQDLASQLESACRARAQAEERLEQRTQFLARLSHELRTPLTTMVGFSQLLALDTREPMSPAQKHKLSYVIQSGALLQRLVDDMSNLSAVDEGDLTVRRAEVDVGSVIDAVVGMMTPVACRLGVELQEPVVAPGCRVWGDEERLVQILLNLVGNAIKYNRQGGSVWITVEPRYELLVAISVHDTGQGIDASRMSQLFEPFNRLGRETSDIPGTGLGLAHCKLLAALMGGHIDATSQAGQGTHMMLTLPGASTWAGAPQYEAEAV